MNLPRSRVHDAEDTPCGSTRNWVGVAIFQFGEVARPDGFRARRGGLRCAARSSSIYFRVAARTFGNRGRRFSSHGLVDLLSRILRTSDVRKLCGGGRDQPEARALAALLLLRRQ